MSEDYRVGYKKPPLQHKFKPGNQAARDRKRKKKECLSIAELFDKALTAKRKIKRGNDVISLSAMEILIERLVQAMISGSARDMALIIGLIERHCPGSLAGEPETLEVRYHRAEGSQVALPPADLWEEKKP